ncbi:MAG: acetyl-CoA carboxylase biotin carboxylase subunit [Calditrichia bacterium]
MKISKILIANRGEIALRIMRTCREMGIATVAVFSEPDRLSPHVLFADEAYCIGPAAASESYLRMDKLIDCAKLCGADAIHPGYGFLSENAAFSKAVSDANLIFVGPRPHTISAMGSKTESRKMMIAAGVPVVPGAKGAVDSLDEAKEVVASIGGYPALIKAAAGGGGKGMRIVHAEEELERALQAARGEAAKAFGDDTVYVEKYLQAPKHIEIQVIADTHGNVVHLWERDCSIQRRHQKVIEECPSPTLSDSQRQHLGNIAVQAAKACDYINAGTVEFIYDGKENFYFLEMNTRLQVEHPVTEMVMGVDLVRLQLEVAAGGVLPFKQDELSPRGHAIECRINAENVFQNFVPSTGKISHLSLPNGPGIRVDSGVDQHSEVTPFYDPMIAKMIVYAGNRDDAIARMLRALQEFSISGIETTVPFCLRTLAHPEFVGGNFTTKFIETYWEDMQQQAPSSNDEIAIATVLTQKKSDSSTQFTSSKTSGAQASRWQMRATPGWRNQ